MIKRNILNKLQQELTQPEILILLGPRQVDKTTLLRMLENYASQEGLKAVFFDLEQPQVLADFNRSDKEIANRARLFLLTNSNMCAIFQRF